MKTNLYVRGICTNKPLSIDIEAPDLGVVLDNLKQQSKILELINNTAGPKVKGPILLCINGGKQ